MVYLKRKLWELEWYSDLEAPRHPRASNPWLMRTNHRRAVYDKPGSEGPGPVMEIPQTPCDYFNYRPIVDIVAHKKTVYKCF